MPMELCAAASLLALSPDALALSMSVPCVGSEGQQVSVPLVGWQQELCCFSSVLLTKPLHFHSVPVPKLQCCSVTFLL